MMEIIFFLFIQKKYLADRRDSLDDDDTTWWIPLSYTYETEANFNDTKPKRWIPKNTKEVVLENLPKDDWLILNIQIAGT